MDNAVNNTTGKRSKKEFRKTISAKLESSLVEFQNGTKEKKFKAAVKRASKLLANDLFSKQKKKTEKARTALIAILMAICQRNPSKMTDPSA